MCIRDRGYHDGSGKVGSVDTEKEKLVPANIREGITLLGVEGTMSGTEDAKPKAKTVTPKTTEQTVLPDTEAVSYTHLDVYKRQVHESICHLFSQV